MITNDDLREYWIKKKDLDTTAHQIDWKLRNKSIANLSAGEQRWWCKHTTGCCGVGTMLVKYKYQDHDNCPRCGQPAETTSHLLQCKGFGFHLLWKDEIDKLQEWMLKQNLHPEIQSIVTKYLHTWRHNQQPTFSPSNLTLQDALHEQRHIGHLQFIEGFWSSKFQQCQCTHLINIKSLQSSQLLLSKTQRRIWM